MTYSYQLKYWPIIAKSEVVRLNGEEILRGIDYAIDYAKGYISILLPIPKASSLEIEYDIIPLGIKRIYQRELSPPSVPPVDGGDVGGRPLTQPSETPAELEQFHKPGEILSEPATPSALRVTGTKTFSVSMGSGRSLTPDQSLRINVDGKVSENVSVIAMLSDQDLPFQPEGMTEDIEDLDQKLIRITSPHVSATLGDYEGTPLCPPVNGGMQGGESEFVAFPRALEGVMVQGNFDWGGFSVIPSAIPKGQSFSKTIQGVEGQSEYRLDADGQYIVVKAGSEIVWLNGERMRRGEDNDYVIQDYGDPTIEFTSKHLITGNDVIRVDFEYIPEDIAYKQSLYGASGKLKLLNGSGTLGLSYAVEADNKDKPYIILSEDDIKNLRNNVLNPNEKVDATGKKLTFWSELKQADISEQPYSDFQLPTSDFRLPTSDSLIAPKKHSVLGFDGQLNLGERTYLMGELAFSNLDYNTFSQLDKVETSPAWKLTANSSTEKLRLNLDLRKLDGKFFPVGGTTSNRGRSRYEKQYQDEKFDDIFFIGESMQQETPTESSADVNVQYEPISGVKLDAGLGRTAEVGSRKSEVGSWKDTINQNFKRGININIPKLPKFHTTYQESTNLKDGREDYRKTRERFDITHRISKVNLSLYDENLESVDLNSTDYFNRNRKRKESGLKAEILDFKRASLSCEYSFEEAFKKESAVSVDGRPLTFSDWTRESTARTASVGMFSKPWTWANLSTNFSRRVFKELPEAETKTNLADVNLGFEPFSGAIDSDISYQIDRKLATERIEIYTNTLYGVPIQPGQGNYVKVDEYHYEEDYENGDYIKIVRTVGDKPVSAVDLQFRMRFSPYRMARGQEGKRARRQEGEDHSPKGKGAMLTEFMAKSFKGEIRYNVTEQQENADQLQLYLLRNRQTKNTIFGRQAQRYRLEFSPTRLFTFNIEYNANSSLNKRVNSREWKQQSRQWNLQASSAPVNRFSLESEWEKQLSFEKMTDLGIQGDAPRIVSNIRRDERTSRLRFQYQLTDKITLGLQGAYETEDDTDLTEDKLALERSEGMDTHTRSLSLENQFSYSFFGKGRVNLSYQIAYGKSKGNLPLAKYNFYDGLSHEVRCRTDYRVKKFTDMTLRFKYRLLATEQDKPEQRAEVEVVAEL
ncbi:hypothetical protein FJZ31_04020 [Candidatus Poribacteria bacterium]|nr:hypothetical protein [Candidatus Poribacteria bacterium]